MRERETAQALHELVGCAGKRPFAQGQACLHQRLLERTGRRDEGHLAVPRSKGEQVTQRDGALRGHRVVERALDRPQDPAVLQLRQPLVDRIVEPDPAFLHENHGADCRDRLRRGGEPENGVATASARCCRRPWCRSSPRALARAGGRARRAQEAGHFRHGVAGRHSFAPVVRARSRCSRPWMIVLLPCGGAGCEGRGRA